MVVRTIDGRRFGLAWILVMALLAGCGSRPAGVVGTWSLSEVAVNGARERAAGTVEGTFAFATDGTVTIMMDGQSSHGTYQLRGDGTYTMIVDHIDQPGIVSVEGDTLTYRFEEPALRSSIDMVQPGLGLESQPTSTPVPPRMDVYEFVLTRVK